MSPVAQYHPAGGWPQADFVYRFYHQSFKVYRLQGQTLRVLAALENLRPGHPLDERFRRIVGEGTGRSCACDEAWGTAGPGSGVL